MRLDPKSESAGSALPVAGDDLVKRALAGETAAFADIVRRYHLPVWRVTAAMLSDDAVAENLVQQTFVNAFERLEQYQLGRDLGRWLKAIARNLVKDELLKNTRESAGLVRYRDYLRMLYQDDPEGDRTIEAEQKLASAVAQCRQRLAPVAALALALRYEEALSLEEISTTLGRTVVATRQLLFRTRETLRLCVQTALRGE